MEFFCIDGKPKDPNAEFFVRQKYHSIADNIHFSTLSPEDLSHERKCPCEVRDLPTYNTGDFVLVREKDRLQPYRFEGYEKSRALVRRLLRRVELEADSITGTTEPAKVNELVWTDEIIDASKMLVVRTCHVVEIKDGQEVPGLVEWANGSSDWFFYRTAMKLVASDGQKEIENVEIADTTTRSTSLAPPPEEPPPSPSEASTTVPDATVETNVVATAETTEGALSNMTEEKKLRGLDLFCGGGNFGRGVADGGAVHHKWCAFIQSLPNNRAVDIEINALHTYRANLEHDDVNLYLGSINNFLFDIITGRRRHLPKRGEIDFIIAGSPCQGFSAVNPQGHEALKSLSNSALICTTISAIDFYRPKYAILENVPAMASDRKYRGQQVNISNQIMCALIGMGYQCRCLLLDAWSFGAPQSRTRLFIEIAAPGCALPEIPQPSHAHPESVRSRALGKTASNVKFASRDLDILTSFPPVKTKDVWDDLPDIGNGHLGVCIPHPEHRTYWSQNARDRRLVAHIPHADSLSTGLDPRYPAYQYALKRNLLPQHLQRWPIITRYFPHRFQRFNPDALVPTVTCFVAPLSPVVGRAIHYTQDRPLTTMEAKRAQGFMDSDVLIGKPARMYRIIGNSVCRQVAFALGVKLAEAVKKGPIGNGIGVPNTEGVTAEMKEVKGKMRESRKFMVLIDNTRKMSVSHKTVTENGVISGEISVQYSVQNGTEKLEVSMESRKRIRIEVENEEDGMDVDIV